MPKTYIRHIEAFSEAERDRLRARLNEWGFYALTSGMGLDVYVTYDRDYLEKKVLDFFRKRD